MAPSVASKGGSIPKGGVCVVHPDLDEGPRRWKNASNSPSFCSYKAKASMEPKAMGPWFLFTAYIPSLTQGLQIWLPNEHKCKSWFGEGKADS